MVDVCGYSACTVSNHAILKTVQVSCDFCYQLLRDFQLVYHLVVDVPGLVLLLISELFKA